jgi:hypothetical protein
MELRVGVVHSPKELTIELDSSADDVVKLIDDGLAEGKPLVWVTDTKGRRVGLPTDKIAYVEVDDGVGGHHVGFGR